jgi:hypothetical protein
MGYFKWLIVLLLFSTPSLAQTPEEEPIITLERTSCFGTCPIYSVQIFEDGKVVYEGKHFVAVEGRQVSKIPSEKIQELIHKFLTIDYFSLQDKYETIKNKDGTETVAFDLPATYTSLRMGSRKKKIKDYFGTPDRLRELENEIDRAVNFHQWWHSQDDLKNWHQVYGDVYWGIKPGQTKLMRASIEWNTATLKKEIQVSGDVDAHDESGWTALMIAAEMCRVESVKLLLQAGAQVWAHDQNGDTPLIGAVSGFCYWKEAKKARENIIRALVAAGSNPNEINNSGETPLMAAADSGSLDAARVLLTIGADIHQRDKSGKTVVEHATEALPKLADTSLKDDSERLLVLLKKSSSNP